MHCFVYFCCAECRGDDGTCYPVDQSAWDAECAQYSCSRSKGVMQLSSQQGSVQNSPNLLSGILIIPFMLFPPVDLSQLS